MTSKVEKNDTSSDTETIRLNVYLQEHGIASRRKADEFIEAGRVKVDGKTIRVLGTRIPKDSVVKVDNKAVRKAPPTLTYLLHKPDLYLTTRKDNLGRKTIFELPSLKGLANNIQSVGRLDLRSEGLLILTNDGDLAQALTHPKYSVEKTYTVLVSAEVSIVDIEKLRAGVMLEDGFAKPVHVKLGNREYLGKTRGQWVELVVTEGRNRLIRRMLEAIGLKVNRLVRTKIGDLPLPIHLGSGQCEQVKGAQLTYLNRIKLDMLNEIKSQPKIIQPTATDLKKRRALKKNTLNDEDYAYERKRQSAVASLKKKERESDIKNNPSAPRPKTTKEENKKTSVRKETATRRTSTNKTIQTKKTEEKPKRKNK
jgi:23S rRNA pseudouridine2605 synthase